MFAITIIVVAGILCGFIATVTFRAARVLLLGGLVCLLFVALIGGYFSYGWEAIRGTLTFNERYSDPIGLRQLSVAGYTLIVGGVIKAIFLAYRSRDRA
jgi:hypothetical protein